MIKKIFNAKHWQVFLVLMFISLIQSISRVFSEEVSIVFYILYIFLYVGWLLALGIGLKSMIQKSAMNYRLFLTVGILLMTVIVFMRIFGEIFLANNFDNMTVIGVMLAFIFTSLIMLCSYVAKNLSIIEKGNDIDINDYFGDIFLLIFWPIGVWTIQPRFNRLTNKLRAANNVV